MSPALAESSLNHNTHLNKHYPATALDDKIFQVLNY